MITVSSDQNRIDKIQHLTWKIHEQIAKLRPLLMVEVASDPDLQDVLRAADEFDTVVMQWTVLYLESERIGSLADERMG